MLFTGVVVLLHSPSVRHDRVVRLRGVVGRVKKWSGKRHSV